MFRSLRNRLILSHILPSLLIIPIMGIAIVYIFENRVLFPRIYSSLSDDAILVAEMTRNLPEIWLNPITAQVFVEGADPYLSGRITMIDPYGKVIASGDQADRGIPGQIIELPEFNLTNKIEIIELQNGPLAEVFVPVIENSGQYLGVVRLTTRLVTVREEIYQLRYLLLGIFLGALFVGVVLGSYLAVSISRPVHEVTDAIRALTQGDFKSNIMETGTVETRTLARAVNSLLERLHAMEYSRHQLLANLVHEIGRPLGALGSAVRALIKGANQDPELANDLLTGMDDEIKRLNHLLEDLTRLYDQDLGPLEMDLQLIDLVKWLPQVIIPWQALAKEKGIQWHTDITSQSAPAMIDSDRMAQAIGNLSSNAIKFTPKGGKAEISTGMSGDQLWIKISDSGPGISPKDQEKIFLQYYRGDQNKTIIQGMGLGLTIARDIVNAHGGRIELESETGKGASFTIWLPQAE